MDHQHYLTKSLKICGSQVKATERQPTFSRHKKRHDQQSHVLSNTGDRGIVCCYINSLEHVRQH